MNAGQHLGDAHNFGRRVKLSAGRIAKPRTVVWEWLLLAADSPLRGLLAAAAERDGLGKAAFDFLPTLRFFAARAGVGGEVERIKLEPLPRATQSLKAELAVIVGRSLALWSWLGASDLHWENLVLGRDSRGQIVFGPLDIEMLLADLASPTETKLLADPDPEYAVLCQHAAGVRRVLPYLGKPLGAEQLVALASAYLSTLDLLGRHAGAIAKVFARLPGFRQAPIRVLLRSTGEYVHAAERPLWPPLLAAETEQLERGDVPYFFRLYGKAGIHFYANRELTRVKRLPLAGDVPQLEPLLDVKQNLASPARRRLAREGVFAVLGAFDHPDISGRHQAGGLAVAFGARRLSVTLPSGETLQSPRNLSQLASSAYLPCRCGEVRSVFVPPVTVCRLARGAV